MILLTFYLILVSISRVDLFNQTFTKDYNSSKQFLNNKVDLNESDIEKRHYCNLCCLSLQTNPIEKICGQHTLCKYRPNETGPECRRFIMIPFSKKEKLLIVHLHNQLRNDVALGREHRGNPGPQLEASNMREMFWSDELAKIAERWGAQCIFKNDVCRDTGRFPVGQNLAEGQFAINDEMFLIKRWYDVVQYYNREYIRDTKMENRFNKYTQIVWADSYLLGCSRIMFQKYSGPEVFYKEHFICNYGPSGNIPGQPVYLIGKACTNCPYDTKCSTHFLGLCTANISSSLMMSSKLSNYEYNFTNRTLIKKISTQVPKLSNLIFRDNNKSNSNKNFRIQYSLLFITIVCHFYP